MAYENGGTHLFTSQPFKTLWVLFSLGLNVARLPFWMLYFIPSFTRQDPAWSYKQAVRVRLIRAFLYNLSYVQGKTPLSLQPGKEGNQFVVISPAQDKYYTGKANIDPSIKPTDIGGTWYPAPPKVGEKPEYVILHFHGGAYAIGDGRSQDAGYAAKTLIANTPATHMFAPQYRLATNPGCRFPAQLQDAITSYNYLVFQIGIHPSKIIVGGDSAGGHMTLMLLKYIAEHGTELGLLAPKCAWLWSAWVAPANTLKFPDATNANSYKDYVGPTFGSWGAYCLKPAVKTNTSLEDPYLKFLDNPFKTEVPLYFTYGECEMLFFDGKETHAQFSKIEGNRTKFEIEPKAVHDIILVGDKIGFDAEAEEAAKKAAAFLKTC